jgi:hypothetical protein
VKMATPQTMKVDRVKLIGKGGWNLHVLCIKYTKLIVKYSSSPDILLGGGLVALRYVQ